MKLSRLIRFKVYYDRAGPYINYVKNLVIIAMAYKLYEDSRIGVWVYDNRYWSIPLIVGGYVLGRLFLGWLDKKYKIREYEIGEYNKTDPNLRMIQKYLKDIKDILDDK